MIESTSDPIAPVDADRQRIVAGTVGGALAAFGFVCWIAANWAGMHRLTKLSLVAAVLVASALAALSPRLRAPASLVTVASIGGLLALIGQTYPSGADAWQLFALWAGVAAPFALAARSDAVWSLWAVVAGAAIGLWRVQEGNGMAPEEWGPAWALALAVAIWLSPHAPWRAVRGDSRWAFRLASLGATTLIAGVAIHRIVLDRGPGASATAVAFVALGCAAAALAILPPLEMGVLAILLLAIDVILVFQVGVAIAPHGPEIGSALVLGLFAAALVGGAVWLLRWIARRDDAPGDPLRQSPAEWPVVALAGFGALFTAIPFLIFYAFVFSALLRDSTGAALLGGATLIAGALILRGGATLGFRQMFGMIAALVGLGLAAYAALRAFDNDAGFALCAVSVATAIAVRARWARACFGFIAASGLIITLFARTTPGAAEYAMALTSFAAAAGGAILAAASIWPSSAAATRSLLAFIEGWTAAGLVALVLLAGRPFLLDGGSGGIGDLAILVGTSTTGPAQAASVLLGLGGAALLFWRRTDLRTIAGLALAAVAVLLVLRSPALGATLLVFACAFIAWRKALAIMAALSIMWVISAFYYGLDWTLSQKAYVLVGLGAALALVALASGLRLTRPATAGPVGRSSGALIALGLLVSGALAGISVIGAERILRDGRTIYIPVAPVDPRSMMQGDYMALAFNTTKLPAPSEMSGEVLTLATVDDRSIATLIRPAAGARPSAGEIILKLRVKSKRWFVGSDAWYFEEGSGDDFGTTRYGVFRVGADGRLLLTGLADENLKILH